MESVKLLAKYKIKEGKVEEFKILFEQIAKHTAKESGNLAYRSFFDHSNDSNFFIYEEYENLQALETHKNSFYFKEIVIERIVPLLESREVFQLNENNF
ncbi:putative quinol monooxygenase [Flavobacterium sp. j3]|uniref:Quinol monooxygenase n=1 Tax=Flavobacterium aureirubrum TaxID=3133147 RepID=A0ABU9NBG2_9FLAO